MFGIGVPELAIILMIVLIIFGAGKLPEIGAGIGRGVKNFKTSIAGHEDQPHELDQGKASENLSPNNISTTGSLE